jgi:hypothetical protein
MCSHDVNGTVVYTCILMYGIRGDGGRGCLTWDKMGLGWAGPGFGRIYHLIDLACSSDESMTVWIFFKPRSFARLCNFYY